VELALAVRNAALQVGNLPAGCLVRTQSATSARVECLVATMAPSTTTNLAIPIVVTPATGTRAGVGASARVLSDTPEQSKFLNNSATVSLGVAPTVSQPTAQPVSRRRLLDRIGGMRR